MRNLSIIQKVIVCQIFVLSLIILTFIAGRLTINLTPSMPVGIWKMHGISVPLDESSRGRFVTFCPPDTELFRAARENGILSAGRCTGSYRPLLKEIVGIPGDLIEYSQQFTVNGRVIPNSEILPMKKGVTLPFVDRLIVPEGKLWIMSPYSNRSFDSRYFGLVSVETIQDTVEPLWTVNSSPY